ncbi:ARM repeat-containing [Chlorella sorokiniana]|uniref:ARM repeat-containing n=1 Tax=Chlorella sorokiniana TaxID=3076 RepID=A0A2P6TBQ3_CHLSO|nr:ARM repeat-containing [Chlorella sorokiniana]|eukprot:PRW18313.1 ARM repeat-containing [Chlorella sorokiniana]
MQDFVRCAALLASPATDPVLRAQADGWLSSFRHEPTAWGVGVDALRASPAAVSPEVRLQAAALLAWKCKHQLAQLQPVQQQLELAEALTALAPEGQLQQQRDVAQRAVCAALANLAIHCPAWGRPLDTLGSRLNTACMLEFLTLLPQEIEDAVAAAQSASAEVAWALKARAHEWSSEVIVFLRLALPEACSAAAAAGSPLAAPSPRAVAAAAVGQPQVLQLTLAVLRCFTAWTKLGCLQHWDQQQAAFFASLAGELLFASDPQHGLPYHPFCLPAAVDAASEHALRALRRGGPEGEALRQGLLQLLALPPRAGGDGGGAALPALAALGDLLEHLLLHHRSAQPTAEDAGLSSERASRVVGQPGRQAFAASALRVLLVQLQPFPAAFDVQFAEPPASELVQRELRSPEGVPDNLRQEAGPVVDAIAELLGPAEAVQQLVLHAQAAVVGQGVQSVAAQAALDASLHLLGSMRGLLETAGDWAAGQPQPAWLSGLLHLVSLVPEVPTAGPLLTILHADMLGCWCQLGGVAMPLLPAQHQQDMQQLVLGQALCALSDCCRTADVGAGSTDDIIERAASAVRVLCSAAASASLPASAALLGGLQRGMALLQQPARQHQYQEAHSQLVAGLVHALHGVPPEDQQLRAQAEAVVQAAVFQPMAAGLQEVHILMAVSAAAQLAALADVCGWLGRLPAGAAAAWREMYHELAQCLCSAMVLEPEAAQTVLPSFADTVASCFFLPGAHALGRPLIQALESPLHGALLGYAAQQGPVIMQGLLLAILSLSSAGSSLPKVVSLMSDTALLATSLAITEQRQLQGQAGSPATFSPWS